MILEIIPGLYHGSCVDFEGKGILAIGPSGTGKSSLALELISLGGVLVSDDQVVLSNLATGIEVTAPDTIKGRIEARNLGILTCPYVPKSKLNLVVDLNAEAKQRLPIPATVKIGDHQVTIIAGGNVANLPISLKLLNLFGRK